MHFSSALLFSSFVLVACGGAVSPTPDSSSQAGDQSTETSGSGSDPAKGSGGAKSNDAPPPSSDPCSYPAVENPEGCPSTYSYAFSGRPCENDGLKCWYPGAGDQEPNGCWAAALLTCSSAFARDGGGPEWRAAQ